jgi:ribosomal protein S18 acetylase RimI-like enzyme
MPQDLRITTFIPHDLEALRAHLQLSWRETYGPVFGLEAAREMAASLSSGTLGDLVPREDEIALIARKQCAIAGCAVIAERVDTVYLWGMYVATRWQRKGVGRALIRHAASLVQKAQIMQATVLARTEPAIQFYKSLGFSSDELTAFELTPGLNVEAYVMSAPVHALKMA